MTNKERYKQAFSVLHTSDQFSVEVENMSRLNKKHNMKVAAAALTGCILLVVESLMKRMAQNVH